MNLPVFRYHPDPILSGSVRAGPEKCRCCGQARGAIYTGPVYAEEDLEEALCPWCIDDGSAHRKFEAEFTDVESLPDSISAETIELVTQRTPGFSAWQGIDWPVCCDDLMAFREPVGIEQIRTRAYYTLEGQLMHVIVHEMGISGGAATRLLQSLHRDRGPTAYAFKCLKCDTLLARIDGP